MVRQPHDRFPILVVEAETMPIPSAFADVIAFFPTVDSYGGCWFPGVRDTQRLAIRCYQGVWREWPTPGDTPAVQFAEFRGRMYARAASLLVAGADGWTEAPTAPYLSAIAAQQDCYLWIATSFDGLWRSPDGVAWRPVPSPSPPGTVAHGLACRADGTMIMSYVGRNAPIPTPLWLWAEDSWQMIDPPNHKHFYYVIKLWCPADGSVWAMTMRGLWRWDGRDWDHVSAPPQRSLRIPYPSDVAIDVERGLIVATSATCGMLARRRGRLVRLEERPNRKRPDPYLPYAGPVWLWNDRLWIMPASDCLQSIDLAQLDAL